MYYFVSKRNPDNSYDIADITFKVEAEDLNDLLEQFELFVRACGFCPKGTLDFVVEQEHNND